MEKKQILIAGIDVLLEPVEKKTLKGLNADTLLRFAFYRGGFNGQSLCFILNKGNEALTATRYRKYADSIENVIGLPVVFLLDAAIYIERKRLIEQGVYFVVSDKYAFLPTMLKNIREKIVRRKKNKLLSPAAQYILLYYLQTVSSKEIYTLKDFEKVLPYPYLTISRAVADLEQFSLCRSEFGVNGEKSIYFNRDRRALWQASSSYLRDPVKYVVYTDEEISVPHTTSGVNALAHYSHLNPDSLETIAVWDKDYRKAIADGLKTNDMEGKYKIEVWIYPPGMQQDAVFTDPLSLYLSMEKDRDPRIEKELHILINTMSW